MQAGARRDMVTARSPMVEWPAAELEALLAPPREMLHRDWTRAVDRAIGWIVEPVAALLIVVEVGILGAGVFSRYVLQDALVWGDELATILFLWLTMLGAVGAYRRNEHLRLTTVIRRVPPHIARVLETIGTVVVAVFCARTARRSALAAGDPAGQRPVAVFRRDLYRARNDRFHAVAGDRARLRSARHRRRPDPDPGRSRCCG